MTQQDSLIPMSPGERLRFERERRGLTVAEAADHLRCEEEVVEALESDRPTRFAPVYHRGYLKNYARWLGIPASEWRDIVGQVEDREPELRSVFSEAKSRLGGERWLKGTSYVLASLLIGTLAWQLVHEAVRLSQGGEGFDADLAVGSVPAERRGTGSDDHVKASIAALDNLRRHPAAPTGPAGNLAWAAMDRADQADQPPLAVGEHRLLLKTSADSWVEIHGAEGVLLEQDLVRGGSTRSYRGFGPFQITLGRSSAAELFLDGRPVDLQPHTRGEVAQMLLDPGGGQSAAALRGDG